MLINERVPGTRVETNRLLVAGWMGVVLKNLKSESVKSAQSKEKFIIPPAS